MEANSPLIFVLAGMLVGFIAGLICYRLVSKEPRYSSELRQTLLEREHHIAELKKAMGSLQTDLGQRLDNIRTETKLLEQQLSDSVTQWGGANKTAHPLTRPTSAISPDDTDNPLDTPRDYADGKGGTLSEDFGLKENSKTQDTTPPQPPRY